MVTVRSEEVSVTVNNTRQHVTRLETVGQAKGENHTAQ